MNKYKIGDKFVANSRHAALQSGTIVATLEDGDHLLQVSGHPDGWPFVARSEGVLEALYDLVVPEPPFFEVGAFYRWGDLGTVYARYEIKEVYRTKQPDGSHILQARAERIAERTTRQVMLDTDNFHGMVRM